MLIDLSINLLVRSLSVLHGKAHSRQEENSREEAHTRGKTRKIKGHNAQDRQAETDRDQGRKSNPAEAERGRQGTAGTFAARDEAVRERHHSNA